MKKIECADRLREVDDKLKHDYAKIEQKILEHNSNLKTAFRSIGANEKAA
jgi:stearoyl-CoA desaturase (delta-9 desaturase)